MKDYSWIIGKKYGRLEVEGYERGKNGRIRCKCKCECGEKGWYDMSNVVSGRSRSCGCYKRSVGLSRRALKDEEYDEAIREIEGGRLLSEVSKEYGISRQSMWKEMSRRGYRRVYGSKERYRRE